MAKTLSKTGISEDSTIEAWHVSQSIDAFTGAEAYNITTSGSFIVDGDISSSGDLVVEGNISLGSTATTRPLDVNAGTGNVPARFLSTDAGSLIQIQDSTFNSYFGIDTATQNTTVSGNAGQPLFRVHANGIQDSVVVDLYGNMALTGSLTSSANISASGTGSFEHLMMSYDNMPTSDPSIKGVIWRDSVTLKISAG